MNKTKNLLLQVLLFLKTFFLQFILACISLETMNKAIYFGDKSSFENGSYFKEINGELSQVGTSVAMNSGYIGGAISMGIISAACIIMIVWIEISKKK